MHVRSIVRSSEELFKSQVQLFEVDYLACNVVVSRVLTAQFAGHAT